MKQKAIFLFLLVLILNTTWAREGLIPLISSSINGDTGKIEYEKYPEKRLSVIAEGDVTKYLTSDNVGTPASGILGLEYHEEDFLFNLKFSIVNSINSISNNLSTNDLRGYGSSILLPYSTYNEIDCYLRGFFLWQCVNWLGLYTSFGGCIQKWGIPISTNIMISNVNVNYPISNINVNFPVLYFSIGPSLNLFQAKNLFNNNLNLNIETYFNFGMTCRFLAGDILNQKFKDFRFSIMNTDSPAAVGAETSFELIINGLKAIIQFIYFQGDQNNGFTGGQLIGQFQVSAPLFGLTLGSKNVTNMIITNVITNTNVVINNLTNNSQEIITNITESTYIDNKYEFWKEKIINTSKTTNILTNINNE